MGVLKLAEVAIDGTRVLASNNRRRTLTAGEIENLLAELDGQLEEALAEGDSADMLDERNVELISPIAGQRSCPDGRRLDYEETKTKVSGDRKTRRRVYRSPDCSGCPLHEYCRHPSAKKNRSVSRDVHEARRQQHAAKMATPAARERYGKRLHSGEVGFALLKVPPPRS